MFIEQTLQNKIETLDWNQSGANTQYLTHSIHRYSGKFIPQIARQAIELLTTPGELVLDPYCGSGTTLLECSLTDRQSVGIDLNPLAVLISLVKTTPINNETLLNFINELKYDLKLLDANKNQQNLFFDTENHKWINNLKEDKRWQDDWYVKWFKDSIRLELIAIYERIHLEKRSDLRNVALVAFSDILRKSSNAHSSYPNVMFDKKKEVALSAIPRFISRLEENAQSLIQLETVLQNKPLPKILCCNNRNIPIDDSSIDAVITHPPYIGSIPYAEYGLLSLTWLGYDAKQLDRELTGGRRQSVNVVEQFYQRYSDMIKESHRVLKPGRSLLLLVGNPVVRGIRIDLAKMTKEIANIFGFINVANHKRMGTNRRANLMGQEDLLLFQKL